MMLRLVFVLPFLVLAGCQTYPGEDLTRDELTGNEGKFDISGLVTQKMKEETVPKGSTQPPRNDPDRALNQHTLLRADNGILRWTTPEGHTGYIPPDAVAPSDDTWLVYYFDHDNDVNTPPKALMAYLKPERQVAYLALSIEGANAMNIALTPSSLGPNRILYFGVDDGSSDENPLEVPAVILRGVGVPLGQPPLEPGELVNVLTVDAAKQIVWRTTQSPVLSLPKKGKKEEKLIPVDAGFCYVSLIDGDFRGPGEKVYVTQKQDGYWYLVLIRAGGMIHTQATCVEITP